LAILCRRGRAGDHHLPSRTSALFTIALLVRLGGRRLLAPRIRVRGAR
jgi:hypothetical protein